MVARCPFNKERIYHRRARIVVIMSSQAQNTALMDHQAPVSFDCELEYTPSHRQAQSHQF